MSKIALAIIAKDEVEKVKSIIDRYSPYFDEIAVAADQRIDEFIPLANDKVSIYPYVWCDDFSHKRNFLAGKIKSPIYFRLDTDDEIENPQLISDYVKAMDEKSIDVLYFPYDYAKDQGGLCIAKHWRETIVRKRPDVYWKKTIHENVFMENKNSCTIVRDDRLKIIHNITSEHAQDSYKRNMQMLIKEFEKDGVNADPRTIAYIGRMLMAKGEWQKAILFLENLIRRSGWDDDKYFAWIQMSQCYQMLGKMDTAIGCANEALGMNTRFPDAYLQMGAVYLQKGEYQKAVDWIMPGVVRPEPDTMFVIDPTFYGYKAKINAALALLGKGDIPLAMKYYREAEKLAPNEPYVKSKEEIFVNAFELDQYIKNLAWMASYIRKNEPTKVKSLIDSMPQRVFVDERSSAIRNEFSTPRVWGSDEIAIFCGQAWEEWSPLSTYKGIGGSEEAVIYLSKELTRLGYKVTVFNSCGESSGIYDGVEYKNFYEFSPKDTYNILISWRLNYFTGIKARKKFIWLHDVPQDGMFPKESLTEIDKIVVLSEYHKSLMPEHIPQEKIFVSANGINLSDFKESGVIRNPTRMIYTSSYDRGIIHLLEMWPRIRQEVPSAELHIFYGWNTFDAMAEKGARDPRFKTAMVRLMNQEGITEHGRVGHKQLVKEFQMSGLWVYPSHFEEISCISAMKAQAAGCVPVCTDYAALSETVKSGIKVHGKAGEKYENRYGNASSNQESNEVSGDVNDDKRQSDDHRFSSNETTNQVFLKELIKILKDEKRQEEIRQGVIKHQSEFGWDRVAKQWHKYLFTEKEIEDVALDISTEKKDVKEVICVSE